MKISRQTRFLCTYLMLVVLSLCGCAELREWKHNGYKVGPNYCAPPASISNNWIDFNEPQVISQGQGVDEGAWWQSLNDPVMNQLIAQAHNQNLSLRAAGMRIEEARAQRAIAAGMLFPQFQQAFAGYNRIQVSRATVPTGPRSFDLWSNGFNVGWEVDLWGKFRRNLEAADANLDASINSYDDIIVCLIAETAANYVEIREFEQRLEYANQNLKTQQGSLEIAESRHRNGAVSELDVTQAKSSLAQTKALIPLLKKGMRLANNRLCVLLGTPPRNLQPEIGTAPIPTAPREVVVGIPAELLRRRPDIRVAERNVARQSALIGVATADLFPSFTINGSINWEANNFSDMFSSAANGGAFSPAFNWNVLNYGRIRSNIDAQEARFHELVLLYQETVLEANAEAEDAITCFLQAQEEVEALLEGVEASQRSVELALVQYREGATDFNRVFNMQTLLVQQQDQLASAQSGEVLCLIRIYKALGGGWRIRCDIEATPHFVEYEVLDQPEPEPPAFPIPPAPTIKQKADEKNPLEQEIRPVLDTQDDLSA